MTSGLLTAYLAQLGRELGRRGVVDTRILDEVRDHLSDAVERELQRGMSADIAEHEAIARFGSPKTVAVSFADERYRMLTRMVFLLAVLAGVAIAYMDSRPHWDDTGITAFSMVLAAGVCGLIAPMRPWRWALLVGIWIPLHTLVQTGSLRSLIMLVVLAFPFAGAYAGTAMRRALAMR